DVPVLLGDATSSATLRRARVDRARALVALVGDDAANAEIAVNAARHLPAGATAFIGIRDRRLADELRNAHRDGIETIHLPELLAHHAISKAHLDRTGTALIVGYGTLGQAVAAE